MAVQEFSAVRPPLSAIRPDGDEVRFSQNSLVRVLGPTEVLYRVDDSHERIKNLVENGFDTVIFDLESTLDWVEAFEYWGWRLGIQSELQNLTDRAMGGQIPFNEAVKTRLSIVRPNTEMVDGVDSEYIRYGNITPGAFELIQLLQNLRINVVVICGGYKEATQSIEKKLGVYIFANHLIHDSHGEYVGYAHQEIVAQEGGKDMLLDKLRKKGIIRGRTLMVGDGDSDMKIKDVDLRVNFAGWALRENKNGELIADLADVVLSDLSILALIAAGRKRWDKVRYGHDKNLVGFFEDGLEQIRAGNIYIRNQVYKDEFTARLRVYTDPMRDPDVVKV